MFDEVTLHHNDRVIITFPHTADNQRCGFLVKITDRIYKKPKIRCIWEVLLDATPTQPTERKQFDEFWLKIHPDNDKESKREVFLLMESYKERGGYIISGVFDTEEKAREAIEFKLKIEELWQPLPNVNDCCEDCGTYLTLERRKVY